MVVWKLINMNFTIKKNYRILTNEVAHQLERPVLMSDDIDLIPRTHMVDGEKQLLQVVL